MLNLPTLGFGIADWIIYAGAVSTAIYFLWKFPIRPIWRTLRRIDTYGPVLSNIARDFPDEPPGFSLKNRLDKIDKTLSDQHRLLERLDKGINGR